MPPPLASALTWGFILVLFWRDVRERPNISIAGWLPLLWMVIIASRYVSQWLDPSVGLDAAGAQGDGSALDRLIFIGLIFGGILILLRRRVNLIEVAQHNAWLTIFLLYCLLAVLWSDFPFVAFKRWMKVLGHPVMALVILTDPNPEEALRRLLKRCTYLLVPLSILFIKYYPELGRGFSFWSGEPENYGVTMNKNSLGQDYLVFGLFLVANFLRVRASRTTGTESRTTGTARREEMLVTVALFAMNWWLLSQADSKTSLVALLAGAGMMLLLGLGGVRRYAGAFISIGVVLFVVSQLSFDLYGSLVQSLGRNATLTDRTAVWEEVMKVDINPVVGAGFESFWLGERLEKLWRIFPFRPIQAHNGYIETYLNLGYIGVFVLVALLFSTYLKSRRELGRNPDWGRCRMGVFLAVVLLNYTEASFKALHLLWFVFYLIALDYQEARVPVAKWVRERALNGGLNARGWAQRPLVVRSRADAPVEGLRGRASENPARLGTVRSPAVRKTPLARR